MGAKMAAAPLDRTAAQEAAGVDPARFRSALGNYPTGVAVITSIDEDDRPVAMVVGTFTSVSLEPPLVGFFPMKESNSWARIAPTGRFCVNILASGQGEYCRRFSSKMEDKFQGVAFTLSGTGCPVLADTVGWIDCTIHQVHDAGDHSCVLGLVQAFETDEEASPMLFCKGGLGEYAAAVRPA